MTSLDNLEKQLAFLKNSMEKLDQPKVEEAQEKTRDVNASSIYGVNETEVKSAVKDSDDAATIKNRILGIIGNDSLIMGEPYSVQNYINTIHSQHEAELAKAKAPAAAPVGISGEGISSDAQAQINAANRDKEDAIRDKKEAIDAGITATLPVDRKGEFDEELARNSTSSVFINPDPSTSGKQGFYCAVNSVGGLKFTDDLAEAQEWASS